MSEERLHHSRRLSAIPAATAFMLFANLLSSAAVADSRQERLHAFSPVPFHCDWAPDGPRLQINPVLPALLIPPVPGANATDEAWQTIEEVPSPEVRSAGPIRTPVRPQPSIGAEPGVKGFLVPPPFEQPRHPPDPLDPPVVNPPTPEPVSAPMGPETESVLVSPSRSASGVPALQATTTRIATGPVELPEQTVASTPSLAASLPRELATSPVDRLALAESLFAAGEAAMALSVYEAVDLQAVPIATRAWIRFQIAGCHRRLGNRDEAMKRYRQLVTATQPEWISDLARWWIRTLDADIAAVQQTEELDAVIQQLQEVMADEVRP